MATDTFMCVLSLYVVSLLSLSLEVFAQRSCSPGMFCPIGANCTSNTNLCVIHCATETDHIQQGNHLTGNCERIPNGTDHWMDSTFYEIFILSNQPVNTPILNISFISTEEFQTNDFTYQDLVDDITFTLIGSCPYFYFTNMLKSFKKNYYNLYFPDDNEGVSLALAETVPPDDYEMEVTVTNAGTLLERRDIIVHVRDVPPCNTGPETFVDFSSSNFTVHVSKLACSLVVTLVSSGKIRSQSFIIGIIAEADNSSEFPATAGVDFTPGRYNATFTTGATTATTSIPIIAGGSDEDDKQFSLRLFLDGTAYQQCIFSGNISTATVLVIPAKQVFNVTTESVTTCGVVIGSKRTITSHDDRTTVCQSQYSAVEDGDLLQGVVILSHNASEDVIVEVTISDGSANPGVDYAMSTALVFNVTISAGSSTSSSFSIDIINDMIQEDNENFNIAIPSCSSSKLIFIIDDDVALITFTSSTFSGLESSGVISASIAISGGIVSSEDINIPITFTQGTASGNDFTSTTQTVIIIAGTNSSMVNIPVTDDNIVEGNETFSMSLTVPSSLGPGITTGTITSATVTIIDTTEIRVRFVSNQYTGSETSGFVLVTLKLVRGTSAYPFNVTVTPLEQSPVSAEGGVDFNTTTLIATFASGMKTSNVRVPIIVDRIAEEREEFDLSLNVPSSLGLAIAAGGRDSALGVITDFANITLKFNQSVYSVNEDMKLVEVVLVLSNPISTAITLKINDSNSTASRNVDYTPGPYDVMILAGTTSVSFDVSIEDDILLEGNEYFTLSIISFHLPNVTITNHQARITIVDNDRATIRFNGFKYFINPNSSIVQPVLVLNISSSVNISIEVKIRGYEPFPVLFPARETMASFDVPLANVIKTMKNIRLVIVKRSLPYYVICDSNCNIKVIMK